MSSVAIRCVNLSKQYQIGGRQGGYRTLRESLNDWASAPWRWLRRGSRSRGASGENRFWALKDVNLEIPQGSVVGIIGPNGAGKSTLLKVLSKITEPTCGHAEIHGRVGSLLEVGTGFHPELTGRENVFLNGAILGMSRLKIRQRFDEIVDFAGVEKFIDTPVKHYSSGMYLRLAFAVAAYLEPEILLVDEVLAVGDIAFQKKCLGRMDEVAKGGRTVLFVSHNMAATRSLCNTGIFMNQGRVEIVDDIARCIERYYQAVGAIKGAGEASDAPPERGGFGRVSLPGCDGTTVPQGQPFDVCTTLNMPHEASGMSLFCALDDPHGRSIFQLRVESNLLGLGEIPSGLHEIRLKFPALWLNAGLYSLYFKAILWQHGRSTRWLSDCLPLDVNGANGRNDAVLHPHVEWQVTMREPGAQPSVAAT